MVHQYPNFLVILLHCKGTVQGSYTRFTENVALPYPQHCAGPAQHRDSHLACGPGNANSWWCPKNQIKAS